MLPKSFPKKGILISTGTHTRRNATTHLQKTKVRATKAAWTMDMLPGEKGGRSESKDLILRTYLPKIRKNMITYLEFVSMVAKTAPKI